MFPLKKSKHNTELRRTKKFEEKIKRTERYKKSSIPYMQKLLNEDINRMKNQMKEPG